MDFKTLLAKLVSIALILFGLYQILLSLRAVFFIYPYLRIGSGRQSNLVLAGMIEKALVLYVTMVVNGVYGMTLLLKPNQEIKLAHVFLGFLIIVVSLLFVAKTPFTTDPISNLVLQLLEELGLNFL